MLLQIPKNKPLIKLINDSVLRPIFWSILIFLKFEPFLLLRHLTQFPHQILLNNAFYICETLESSKGFSSSSAGKKSAFNARDPSQSPGLGRSPGGETDYPLQRSWASLVAQMVKDLPAVQQTWVQSLSWEDPPKKGMATNSSIPAWRIPTDREAWRAIVHGVTKSQT